MNLCILLAIFVNVKFIKTKFLPENPDFLSVYETSAFVDKSLLLMSLFRGPRIRYVVLPPKFGKTTNLDMVRAFLETPLNKTGGYNKTAYLKHKTIFKTLKIFIRHYAVVKRHFCAYPVISVDFKVKDKIMRKDDVINIIAATTHKAYKRYKHICKEGVLNEKQTKLCINWCSRKKYKKMTEDYVRIGLFQLQNMLHYYYKKKVILIMDNHDDVVDNAMLHASEYELNKTVDYMSEYIMNTFKARNVLFKCIVTGVRYVESYRIKYIPTPQFLEYNQAYHHFGMTSLDVYKALLKTNKSDRFERDLKFWIEPYNNKFLQPLYNPYSVMQSLHYLKVDNYWINCTRVDLQPFFRHAVVEEKVRRLLEGIFIPVSFIDSHAMSDVINLKRIIDGKALLNNKGDYVIKLVLTFFFNRGYISYMTIHPSFFKLTNKQIEEEFSHQMGLFYAAKYKVDLLHLIKCALFFTTCEQLQDAQEEFSSFFGLMNALFLNVTKTGQQLNATVFDNVMFAMISSANGFARYYNTFLYNGTDGVAVGDTIDYILVKDSFAVFVKVGYVGETIRNGTISLPNGTMPLQMLCERDYKQIFNNQIYTYNNISSYVLLGVSANVKGEMSCGVLFSSQDITMAHVRHTNVLE